MVIHPLDNVEIHDDGHKYARRLIKAGEDVIKYGMPIGHAVCDIPEGEHEPYLSFCIIDYIQENIEDF